MHQHHHDSLFRFHRRLANLRILEISAIRHGYLESRNSIVVVVSDADFWHELRTRHPQHGLFHSRSGLFDHLSPHDNFSFDASRERFRRSADRI